MEKFYDVVIIGGGPAGLSAAIYAARSGVSVAVIESLVCGGVAAQTPVIENYPGFESITGFELSQKMLMQAQACGAEIIYSKAEKITDGEKKLIPLQSGDVLSCYAVVFAIGNEPRKLGIDREDELLGAGLSYCATCDGNFFRGKKTVVAGGGSYAVSAAEYLLPIASEVTMIHSGKLPEVNGAARIENARIISLIGKPLCAVEVKTGDKTRTIETDGLFVSLGFVPANALVKGLVECDDAGYIICD